MQPSPGHSVRYRYGQSGGCGHRVAGLILHNNNIIPSFTAEAPTCFDSYNQPRLGGGRLFEYAALNRRSVHLSQLAPCCPVAV